MSSGLKRTGRRSEATPFAGGRLPQFATVRELDLDAGRYLAAVEAADGARLEPAVRAAVNAFVVGCKADNILTLIKAACILAGARTLSGALVPLVGAAPTNFNFVSGDYSRRLGLLGNGTTKYLNSNRASNADPQNSFHLSTYVHTTSPGSYMGDFDTNNGNLLQLFGGYHYGYARSSTSAPASGIGNSTAGFLGTVRSASGSFSTRIGATNYSVNNNSVTPPTRTVYVFGRNHPSAALTDPTAARLSFYSIGEALDLALLDSRVTTLINALAAALP